MTARLRELSLTLLLLFVLLAIEFGMAFLPLARSLRPLILIPTALMVCVVGSVFMEARQGPVIVRLFIVAGLLWLGILLGLGSLDPLTRRDYYLQNGTTIPGPAKPSATPPNPL
jgi:cytochrome c oxidase subunit IV